MTATDIWAFSATELLRGYASRTVSPVEVMAAILQRTAAVNPKINALFHVIGEEAMDQARASEARWAAGRPLGALDGVPISIKDSIAAAGMPYWRGSKGNMHKPFPRYDAPPVSRLKEAGAIIFAKATMPDFGMFGAGVSTAHGITRNPWNLAFNTGGSTSGGAAAVAAGLGPLTVGSDIGGSVRLPASLCGLVSIKPTQGRIPHLPPSAIRSAGPLARTVEDTALLLTVLSGADARDYGSLPPDATTYHTQLANGVAGKRIGVMMDVGFGPPVEPAVATSIEAAAAAFAAAGATIERLPPLLDFDPTSSVERIFAIRSRTELDSMAPETRAGVHPAILKICASFDDVTGLALAEALDIVERAKAATVAVTSTVDYVLSPTTSYVSFPAEDIAPDPENLIGLAAFTLMFNQTGQPAAVVCCGFDDRHLPIGLQIIGDRFDDLGVLQLAAVYEAIRGFDMPWPDLAG